MTIREENAAAALEVMSRFAANPKWLVYLPPTMSPIETGEAQGLLEHPAEAFLYYRTNGVWAVVTRTGRRFFEDAALERELLATVRTVLDAAVREALLLGGVNDLKHGLPKNGL